mgnify:CR=1 FL=1
MEIDPSWLLVGLPLAFVMGWLASRLDVRQLRLENRSQPKAYFKGLNHLLNEQQDQAIDAFILVYAGERRSPRRPAFIRVISEPAGRRPRRPGHRTACDGRAPRASPPS